MRTSSLKTTAAVLRATINQRTKSDGSKPYYDQAEWARILGYSLGMIKAVESGKEPLSEAMATKLVHETDIDLAWLLDGDVAAPLMAADGTPFTAATFERKQANKQYWDTLSEWELAAEFLRLAGRMRGAIHDAQGREDVKMTLYKLSTFLGTLPGGRADTEAEDVRWMRALKPIESDIAIIRSLAARISAHLALQSPAKPTKKGAPAKARPRSRKRKG
jgi:hypothetical protein